MPLQPPIGGSHESPGLADALERFASGRLAASVRELKIRGRRASDIDAELGGPGGWQEIPGRRRMVSSDGEWTKTDTQVLHDPITHRPVTPYRMIIYEHVDGGIVRLKPDGVPDSAFEHMRRPHGTCAAKLDAAGEPTWENEAFKIVDGVTITKHPLADRQQPGLNHEEWWTRASHQPLVE